MKSQTKLLVMITVAGMSLLAALVVGVLPSIQRSRAISALQQDFSCTVNYQDYLMPIDDLDVTSESLNVESGWLRSKVGSSFLPVIAPGDRVLSAVLVASSHTPPSWNSLAPLADIPEIKTLYLDRISDSLADEGTQLNFEVLKILKNLRYVSFASCNFSDSEAQHLLAHTPIEVFEIYNTEVTFEFPEEFKPSGTTRNICLYGRSITDRSIRTLNKFTEVTELCLAETNITSQGLAELNLPRLTEILLLKLTVDRKAMEALSRSPIKKMSLIDSHCNDNDLEPVLRWPELEDLYFSGTNASPEFVARCLQIPSLKHLYSSAKFEAAMLVDAVRHSNAEHISVEVNDPEQLQAAAPELNTLGWRVTIVNQTTAHIFRPSIP